MPSLGVPELLIIAVIALVIFGPKKLPELGKGLGKSIRDFKDAMSEKSEPDNKVSEKDKDKETVTK